MKQERHMVDGPDIESHGRVIAIILVFVSNKDNSSTKVIHSRSKEAIKHLLEEGFNVIQIARGIYDDSPGMHLILEKMASSTNEHSIVSIRSGNMDKFPNFDRTHNALIQHMTVKGFKRL
jgi:hypothetical protein